MARILKKLINARREALTPSMSVLRAMPSIGLKFIGPFIFLDHFGPVSFGPKDYTQKGTGPHPHRGFITLSYLLSGEMEHYDSKGHKGVISNGGLQWMKAASGLQHDERPSGRFIQQGGTTHGLQLWINLPAARKGDAPEYVNVTTDLVPEVVLNDEAGLVRVLVGEYQGKLSAIPQITTTFAYHIKLNAGQQVTIDLPAVFEAGAYGLQGQIMVEGQELTTGQLAAFEAGEGGLHISNPTDTPQEVLLIGGEPLNEPMASYGPFVMNTRDEIDAAIMDFEAGKFGDVIY